MIKLLQVTIGAANTQVSATSIKARQVIIQNNATHTFRVGDWSVSNTKGIELLANSSGSMNIGALTLGTCDLSELWVNGTQNDLVDVLYIDPVS